VLERPEDAGVDRIPRDDDPVGADTFAFEVLA
jgi:hypothetical protein